MVRYLEDDAVHHRLAPWFGVEVERIDPRHGGWRVETSERFRASDVVPIIDVGLVEQVRAGRIEPVAAVEAFAGEEVVLADGERLGVDTVIVATGYRTGLEPLVGHLGIPDAAGRPRLRAGRTHPAAPGLHAVGLRNPLVGLLNAIRMDAGRVARAIERELRPAPAGRYGGR